MQLINSWKFWLVLIVLSFFIIYWFWGGQYRHCEVKGLRNLRDACLPPEVPNLRNSASNYPLTHEYLALHNAIEITPSFVDESNVMIPRVEELSDASTTPAPIPPYVIINEDDQTPPTPNFKSKGEEFACQALERVLGRPVEVGVRNLGIINPITGRQLEIDCFDRQTGIGVEYNGEQHYHYPNRFHRTQVEFEAQLRRDFNKTQQCQNLGIYLIKVPFTVDQGVMTASGYRTRRHTHQQRYSRIHDYLEHVIAAAERGFTAGPHYTTHFIAPEV
jgi:hypothetical protein